MPTLPDANVWIAVGTSSVASALISLAVTAWRERGREARDKRADALTLARALEQYTRSCARMIEDASFSVMEAQREHDYKPLGKIRMPRLELPEVAWKAFSPSLVDRVKGLNDLIEDEIADIWRRVELGELEDPFQTADAHERGAVRFGEEAMELADEVRREMKLPSARSSERLAPSMKLIAQAKEAHEEYDARIAAGPGIVFPSSGPA